MVSSIRFGARLLRLFKVINNYFVPTELGEKMLNDNGWNPYIKAVASLFALASFVYSMKK